jgi:hypothetical protein
MMRGQRIRISASCQLRRAESYDIYIFWWEINIGSDIEGVADWMSGSSKRLIGTALPSTRCSLLLEPGLFRAARVKPSDLAFCV